MSNDKSDEQKGPFANASEALIKACDAYESNKALEAAREWTLVEHGCGDPTYVLGPDIPDGTEIRVVEYSALEAAQARIIELTELLLEDSTKIVGLEQIKLPQLQEQLAAMTSELREVTAKYNFMVDSAQQNARERDEFKSAFNVMEARSQNYFKELCEKGAKIREWDSAYRLVLIELSQLRAEVESLRITARGFQVRLRDCIGQKTKLRAALDASEEQTADAIRDLNKAREALKESGE